MRRNRTLLHLARIMKKCNEFDLPCKRAVFHYGTCIDEMADDVMVVVNKLLEKPEIRSCRISLVIDFDRMTKSDFWLDCKIFSELPPTQSEALKLKFQKLVNMLQELQIKILQVDVDYAEKVFKRMAARLEKSTHTLDYELWRIRHPHPTIKQLIQQQVQLTADMLIKGVLYYDEDPKGDEIAAVKLELVKKDIKHGQELPGNFVEECAKLKRYSYWKDERMFMIDYQEIYTYLFSHCFEKFTKEQRIALYEYDVQLKMIHEDIINLKQEQNNYEKQASHTDISVEELFKFIHPTISDEDGLEIDEEVKRLVRRQGLQMICEYLQEMARDKKILLPPNPSPVYAELVRLGMPTGKGFSEKHFSNQYLSK